MSKKHSRFPASSSERWINCTKCITFCETHGEPPTENKYMIEGTKAHSCLEFFSKRRKSFKDDSEGLIAKALNKWEQEMIDHAVTALGIIQDLKPEMKAELHVERKVKVLEKDLGPVLFGTLDYAWVGKRNLVVIDYKYGAGHLVTPFDDDTGFNPQLMYYALGLWREMGSPSVDIKLAVIQPRVWGLDQAPILTAHPDVGDLLEFEHLIKRQVKAASSPAAEFKTGDWCRWCPAAAKCPALSAERMKEAGMEFDVETLSLTTPEPLFDSLDQVPRLLKVADQLEAWIDGIRDYAYNAAMKGKEVPGYKLVAKRGVRKWAPEAETAAVKEFGNDAFETSLLSPAQLEKKFKKTGKAFAEEYSESVSSSGFTLVPDADKREAIDPTTVLEIETHNDD